MESLNVSIIIPTYKIPLTSLQKCLNSVVEYTDLSSSEIIVVSNGQSDEVNRWLQSIDGIKTLMFSQPLGFAKAINEGIAQAQNEYIVLLNDDIELLPQRQNEWIDRLYAPFAEDSNTAITGVLTNRIPELSFDFLLFFCVMLRKSVFEELGGLDEGYKIGGWEDADFCLKAVHHGYKIYCVDKVYELHGNIATGTFPIYHYPDTTVQTIEDFPKQFNKNYERLLLKWKFDSERLKRGRYEKTPIQDMLRWLWIKKYLMQFIDEFNRKPNVLELGCGTGYQLQILYPYINRYVGIDKDENVIRFAQLEWPEENFTFVCQDIEEGIPQLDNIDFVICCEVLEHTSDMAKTLSDIFALQTNVLLTVPYDEPEGYWGPFHKHWHIKEDWFVYTPSREIYYQTFTNEVVKDKPESNIRNIFVFYPKEDVQRLTKFHLLKPKILVYTSTKNRYWTTLPLTILSVATQTVPPDKYIILDDGEHVDLRQNTIYQCLFQLLQERGIEWQVIFTPQHGQVRNHELVNSELSKGYDWCWRIDDDEVAEPTVIERFVEILLTEPNPENIGAIGFSVRVPNTGANITTNDSLDKMFAVKLADIALPNLQYNRGCIKTDVEHLYSSFFYRPNIVHFDTNLSVVGHTEETIFSYELYKLGYRLIVDLSKNVYHFQQLQGGIRSFPNPELWENDTKYFLSKYGKFINKFLLICNPNGYGDNLVMAKVIKDNIELFKDCIPLVATAYPQAYENVPCKTVGLDYPVRKANINPVDDNIYHYMMQHKIDNLYNAYFQYIRNNVLGEQWQKRLIFGV